MEEVQSFVVDRLVAEDVGIDLDPFCFHEGNEQSYNRSTDFTLSLNGDFDFDFDFEDWQGTVGMSS